MPLLSPDEADNTSRIKHQTETAAKLIYAHIENAVKEKYVRGKSLDIALSGATSDNVKERVRVLCGKDWHVSFVERFEQNEYDYWLTITAADEIAGMNQLTQPAQNRV